MQIGTTWMVSPSVIKHESLLKYLCFTPLLYEQNKFSVKSFMHLKMLLSGIALTESQKQTNIALQIKCIITIIIFVFDYL